MGKTMVVDVILPSGKYYIGDICYALKQNLYGNVWGAQGYENGMFHHRINGHAHYFAVAGTYAGDGGYTGSDGRMYGVDAGVIGIVDIALCKDDIDDQRYNFQTFNEPVHFYADDGVFTINSGDYNLEIDTRCEEIDDDSDDDVENEEDGEEERELELENVFLLNAFNRNDLMFYTTQNKCHAFRTLFDTVMDYVESYFTKRVREGRSAEAGANNQSEESEEEPIRIDEFYYMAKNTYYIVGMRMDAYAIKKYYILNTIKLEILAERVGGFNNARNAGIEDIEELIEEVDEAYIKNI